MVGVRERKRTMVRGLNDIYMDNYRTTGAEFISAFGVGAGEILAAVQIAMIAGLPYTALRDAVLTHPTLTEGLSALFSSAPSAHNVQGMGL